MEENQQEKMVLFIIPAYNEEKNIPLLFKNIKEVMDTTSHRYKIALIDDGSSDRTKEIAESFTSYIQVIVIRHSQNRGLGEAIKTGFCYALSVCDEKDIIVTEEADNTSDLLILKNMIEKVVGGYDMVIASYHSKGGKIVGVGHIRKLLSYLANIVLRAIYPINGIRTYTSLYRSYSCALLRKAFKIYGNQFIKQKGFACTAEVLIKLNKLKGVRFVEVPGVLRGNKRIGESKMGIIRNIFDYIGLLFRGL